jgi:hypothetical protein
MKTLKAKREGHEKEPHAGDFYVVACEYSTWYVSAETAARIGEVLDRLWRPRWIKWRAQARRVRAGHGRTICGRVTSR